MTQPLANSALQEQRLEGAKLGGEEEVPRRGESAGELPQTLPIAHLGLQMPI